MSVDHQNAQAYYGRGLVHVRLGRFKQALGDFDFAILARPNYAAAHFQRARLHHRQRRFLLAAEDYTAVLALDPGFVPALDNRGRVWALLGEPAKAIGDYDRALALDPGRDDIPELIEQVRSASAEAVLVHHVHESDVNHENAN